MTRKEKLYKELLDLENELREINGATTMEYDVNSVQFMSEAQDYTIEDLKRHIEAQKRSNESALKKKEIEDYYKTDAGMYFKETILKEIDEAQVKRENSLKNASQWLNTFVKAWLGNEWAVNMYNYSMEIGITEKVRKADYIEGLGSVRFVFGHSFTVYFYPEFAGKTIKEFSLNYGSMGKFELLADNTERSKFLLGLGKFADDKTKLEKIKIRLQEYVDEFSGCDNDLRTLNNRLRNPFEEGYML